MDTSVGEAGTPERDRLLATKLHVPRPRPGLLARPRLLDRLTEGTAQELTLVCAPAGFGKTSLLADWARRSRRPVAWLSLDGGDGDPARFWRYVAAALDKVRPGVGRGVDALFQGAQPPLETVLTVLINDLAEGPEEVVLVLDDYHLAGAPAVHDSLTLVLERLPPQLRLVLASRADPPLPLARLRASGQLTELREADLRFTSAEAATLLRTAVGPGLPEAAVAALGDRTEGWVTGLQLAALSLRGQADVSAFVEGFSGSHRYVLDYLTEEVLDRQPEPLRAFLLETSILERLSEPLCDAVTGRAGSQRLLERAERANLFLVPLDEERGWWRYHHLFADLLRVRLQRERPDRVEELHRAAAAWHEAHGLADEAIGHALAAGDGGWAARLIERQADARILRWEGATLRRWLAALPPELVGSRPRLSLAQANLALISGDLEGVEGPLDAAERGVADADAEEPYEPSVGRAASVLANLPGAIALQRAGLANLRGDAEQMRASATRALAELGEGEWMLESLTHWHLAVAEWLTGRLAEAEAALLASIARWRTVSQHAPAAAALGYHCLGLVQRDQGRLEAALATYREALAVAAEPDGAAPQIAGVAYTGMAGVLYERGDLDAALEHATDGIALSRQLVYTPPLATGLVTLAWIRQRQGDQAGALDALGEAERVQISPGVVGLINPVPAERARLALAHGDVDTAARWVRGRGLGVEDEPSYPREREHLVLARVLLADQAPEQALGLLERLHARAVVQGRTGSVIEVRTLQALALSAAGDQAGALDALAETLALAAPEGYLRVFADEGPPMAALLRQLLAARRQEGPASGDLPRDHLARLVDAFEQAGLPVRPPVRRGGVAVPGLVEPLTERELDVLRLLAAGAPNRAIAEELVVSLDTVKRHVSHLFSKLEVANRTQAVARARQVGLLP